MVLGDNGVILRKSVCRGAKRPWPQGITFERYSANPNPNINNAISRRVHPFDMLDLIGGGDTISVGGLSPPSPPPSPLPL